MTSGQNGAEESIGDGLVYLLGYKFSLNLPKIKK